jgi:hypothetical protein
MAAPVHRLPQDSESYRRRVAQAESHGRSELDITCVHVLALTEGQDFGVLASRT